MWGLRVFSARALNVTSCFIEWDCKKTYTRICLKQLKPNLILVEVWWAMCIPFLNAMPFNWTLFYSLKTWVCSYAWRFRCVAGLCVVIFVHKCVRINRKRGWYQPYRSDSSCAGGHNPSPPSVVHVWIGSVCSRWVVFLESEIGSWQRVLVRAYNQAYRQWCLGWFMAPIFLIFFPLLQKCCLLLQ